MNTGEKRAKAYFKQLGFLVIKLPPIIKGLPDLLILRRDIIALIEVKSSMVYKNPVKKLFKPAQLPFLFKFNNFAYVIHFYQSQNHKLYKVEYGKSVKNYILEQFYFTEINSGKFKECLLNNK